MQKYSQKTLPIMSGKLCTVCPACKMKARIVVETGSSKLYYHSDDYICRVVKS